MTIQNVYGRTRISLNGRWTAIIDPYQHGYWDYQGSSQTDEGYFLDRKPSSSTDRIEYDFDTAEPLDVPGDWNSQFAELLWYEGCVWYRRQFDIEHLTGSRFFLYLAGVNYQARVFVNGHELGTHVGGFTPFEFEVTELVHEQNNSVVILVDNRRHSDGVPGLNVDWWNYGGITRDVFLVRTPETLIRDYSLALDEHGNISGSIQLDGPRRQQDVRVIIREARLQTVVQTDANGRADLALPGVVQRWSPDCPKRYDVHLLSQTDEIRDHIGFRRIETRGHQVLLNGNPLFLRGIALHEQSPLKPGRAHGIDDARTLLGWAKELGANCVRLARYPHNEYIVRLADALGLLVWEEIPVCWAMQWSNRATLDNALEQLTALISRDKNRAAVIIWSVGNETPVGEARNQFMLALIQRVRQLDPSRLVSAALEHRYADTTTASIDDPIGAHLDIVGCNEYIGWYDGLPDKADSIQWRCSYDKPVFITEFGADARQGNHGQPLTRWTEEYQCNVYEHQLRMLDRVPFLCGMSPWVLMDFPSPRRPLAGVLDYHDRKGLVSDSGHRKQAFDVLCKYYRSKSASTPNAHLSMPPWQKWKAIDRATLVFVLRGAEVLLIRKLRGLGAGKINGPGGRIEPGETAIACARREVEEELCVTPLALQLRGELRFQFVDGHSIHGYVFVAADCVGDPSATEEAIPLWTHCSAIPYEQMWADDELWLPHLLAGKRFRGRFLFAGDFMIEHEVLTGDETTLAIDPDHD